MCAVILQQHLVSHARQVGDESMQAGLVLLQCQLRVAVFLTDARFAQIVFDGRGETIQAALEDVIVRTVLHGVDDGLLAQVMGKKQERDVHAAFLQQTRARPSRRNRGGHSCTARHRTAPWTVPLSYPWRYPHGDAPADNPLATICSECAVHRRSKTRPAIRGVSWLSFCFPVQVAGL